MVRSLLALLTLSLLVFLVRPLHAASPGRDEAFERTILAELEALRPEAVPVFREANAAFDRSELNAAADGYERVRALAPSFFHATRRLCGVESARGNRARAIRLCREALAAKETAENRGALAIVLTDPVGKEPAPAGDLAEAKQQVERAIELAPNDRSPQQARCRVAIRTEDAPAIASCSARLEELAPEEAETHAYVALRELIAGDPDAAKAAADRALALGMTPEGHQTLVNVIDQSRSPVKRYAMLGFWTIAAWLGTLALLALAGWLLSRAALRASQNVPVAVDGHARGLDKLLRRVYAAVLWISSAYYYASLPMLAVLIPLIGGGLILALFMIGHVPIKIVFLIAVVVFVTELALLKTLFVRVHDEDPGTRLDLARHPRLVAALHEVAGRIGTRVVDSVYLTPGTEIAVTERGGMFRQLRGTTERCLILGAGVLDGLRVRELKSVLAHEYGHFHNEDTAGGGFAFRVTRSMRTMASHLAQGGVATWYNPAWWFVYGFFSVFVRISHGASRLQEVLADRWAAHAYGSVAFERGLTHVISRSVRFDAHVQSTLREVVEERRPLANLYSYTPSVPIAEQDIEAEIVKELERLPSALDSHPSPSDRVAWVRRLAIESPPLTEEDASEAWDLFGNRPELEQRMTEEIRARIEKAHGVSISAAESQA